MLVINIIIEIIGYNTARLLVPALSFGKYRVQPILKTDLKSDNASGSFNWIGTRRIIENKIEVEATMSGWIGTFFWIILLIIFISISRR